MLQETRATSSALWQVYSSNCKGHPISWTLLRHPNAAASHAFRASSFRVPCTHTSVLACCCSPDWSITSTQRDNLFLSDRLSGESTAVARREFDNMFDLRIIRPSFSSRESSLHMMPKKAPGNWTACADYRALNPTTVPDWFPLHYLRDFTGHLAGLTYVSCLIL